MALSRLDDQFTLVGTTERLEDTVITAGVGVNPWCEHQLQFGPCITDSLAKPMRHVITEIGGCGGQYIASVLSLDHFM